MFYKNSQTDELLRELPKAMYFKLEFIFDYLANRYAGRDVKATLLESYLSLDNEVCISLEISIDRWDRLDLIVVMDCQYTLRIIHCALVDKIVYNPRKVCSMDNPRSKCPETVLSPYRLFRLIEEFRQNGTDYFFQEYGRQSDYDDLRFYIEE
jgi:hypothetical protein